MVERKRERSRGRERERGEQKRGRESEMEVHIAEATRDPLKQLWLEQRLVPFGSPYHRSVMT